MEVKWIPVIKEVEQSLGKIKVLSKKPAAENPLYVLPEGEFAQGNGKQTGDMGKKQKAKDNDNKKVAPHPLANESDSTLASLGKVRVAVGDDPLSLANSNIIDKNVQSNAVLQSGTQLQKEKETSTTLTPLEIFNWEKRREDIIQKYSFRESRRKVVRVTNDEDEDEDEIESEMKVKSVSLSKAKMRLEHLETHANAEKSNTERRKGRRAKAVVALTQKEYMDRISRLHQDLFGAWARNERVLSLKLVIQCAKMLIDVSNTPEFYPVVWALSVDILDAFGNLVYERIEKNSNSGNIGNAKEEGEISDLARERCRNWFFKITCIRELIPRIYIELAMLPCYRFLMHPSTYSVEFPKIFSRISGFIRGIGEPLCAIYCRAYFAKQAAKAYQVAGVSADKSYLYGTINDYIRTMKEYKRRVRAGNEVTIDVYENLHIPAVDIMMFFAGYRASRSDFNSIMQHSVVMSELKEGDTSAAAATKVGSSAVVLASILKCFPAEYYSSSALGLVSLVNKSSGKEYNLNMKAKLFTNMAKGLCRNPPKQEHRISLLNQVWKVVAEVESMVVYADCCAAFIELTLLHYSDREVLILLKDLGQRLKHLDGDTVAQITPQLERICKAVCTDCENSRFHDSKIPEKEKNETSSQFGSIVTSEHFMRILDMFKSEKKTKLCKSLLEAYFSGRISRAEKGQNKKLAYSAINMKSVSLSDPVVIHTVFALCRDLHDSLDALSNNDDRRQISNLICRFIDAIDFGQDLEQQLNVYVDCRAGFSNLDSVKNRLLLGVISLSIKALDTVVNSGTDGIRTSQPERKKQNYIVRKRYHTKRSGQFVKACLAYCFITIPSVNDVLQRMRLFRLCGHIALVNQFLPQTDAFFKASISSITEVVFDLNKTVAEKIKLENILLGEVKALLSALLPVPGNPEGGAFYLVRGLMNAVDRFPWLLYGSQKKCMRKSKMSFYISMIPLLASFAQPRLPVLYRIPNVESNDILYGGHKSYGKELVELINTVVDKVMTELDECSKTDAENPASGTSGMEIIPGNADQIQCEIILDLVSALLNFCTISESNFSMVKKLLALAERLCKDDRQLSMIIQDLVFTAENIHSI